MATLVLTAVGSAIGGPVGGAIGSIIGQQIDRVLFAPKGREGPRLKEIEVQTSSYGTQIPAIFGAMRVAGTVIWATDLIERRSKSSGGKGKPSTTEYSYSVSLAVAVSSMPVVRIGRIWADGNLLRGSSGDFKADTLFRFHNGHADQNVDPLIASAEGIANSPAHRGIAYAVFEDLQLAGYGNRIPSLTFEIFERETEVSLNSIFAVASAGGILASSNETVAGYALSGANAHDAISPLLDSFPIILTKNADMLHLVDGWLPATVRPSVEHVAEDGGRRFERPTMSLAPAYTAPQKLTLRHYEPTRDFQAGMQSSERAGSGRRAEQVELPAALDAISAKRLADLQILQSHRARERLTAQCALNPEPLSAGQWLTDESGRDYQIQEVEHFRGSTGISARASLALDPTATSAASPGRSVVAPDRVPGRTQGAVVDLPVFDTADPGRMMVAVFANGTGNGWRHAALSARQGDALVDIGTTALPAIIGHCLAALPPHSPHLFDDTNYLDIQMLNSLIEIAQIPAAGSLCYVGGEIVRFRQIAPRGVGRYRLTQLQRGCYGTEAAIGTHQAGEGFLWLEQSSARLVDGIALVPGSTLTIEALGIGDDQPALATIPLIGRATSPLSPVHLRGWMTPDGRIELSWVRRSRIDFGWNDYVDQALAEDGEQYVVSLEGVGGKVAEWNVQSPQMILTARTVAELAIAAGPILTFAVRQIGRHMLSDAASVAITVTP